MRKYHVITVHYGIPAPTRTLVEQLLGGETRPNEIVVVDHAEQALQTPPSWKKAGVIVVRPSQNAGYAAGINLGLGLLLTKDLNRSDIVIALNNDTTLKLDSFTKIKDWWEKNPGQVLASNKYGHVDLLTGRSHITPAPKVASRYLPYLHGSLLTASLDTFLRLQGLPNQFFLYWEDVTVSERARRIGLPLRVLPDVGVHHDDSFPDTLSPDSVYYLVRNGAIFLSRYAPRPWRWWWRVGNYARLGYHTLRASRPNTPVVRQALRDAIRRKRGKRP